MDAEELARQINQGPAGPRQRPVVIDPPDCGCTGCILGDSVPLSQAQEWQLIKLFTGEASNKTGLLFDAVPDPDAGTVRVTPLWKDTGTLVADSLARLNPDDVDPRWKAVADGWVIRTDST